MSKFKVGQSVYWNDPAGGETSDFYRVQSIKGDIYLLTNALSETEAFEHEIRYPKKQNATQGMTPAWDWGETGNAKLDALCRNLDEKDTLCEYLMNEIDTNILVGLVFTYVPEMEIWMIIRDADIFEIDTPRRYIDLLYEEITSFFDFHKEDRCDSIFYASNGEQEPLYCSPAWQIRERGQDCFHDIESGSMYEIDVATCEELVATLPYYISGDLNIDVKNFKIIMYKYLIETGRI